MDRQLGETEVATRMLTMAEPNSSCESFTGLFGLIHRSGRTLGLVTHWSLTIQQTYVSITWSGSAIVAERFANPEYATGMAEIEFYRTDGVVLTGTVLIWNAEPTEIDGTEQWLLEFRGASEIYESPV